MKLWKNGAAALMLAAVVTGSMWVQAEELKPVTVILDYVPNTNHTGMYVALEKGYYEAEGLDVQIIEPTDGAAVTLVARQIGTFGVSYQEDVTVALAAKDPLPIKAVAALIQHNTSGFVALPESGIQSPADFEGKTYAGWGGAGESAVLEACMTQSGADFSKLNLVISDGSGFEALGKNCDLMWFFEGWDCIISELNGVSLHYMPCNELDSRLDYYTPVLITSDAVIDEDPNLIRAFLQATELGYRDAIADSDTAAQILLQYAPDYDLELLKRSQAYLAEKYMEDTQNWGEMKTEVWENYTAFMQEYGIIETMVPAEQCFTNEFLGE